MGLLVIMVLLSVTWTTVCYNSKLLFRFLSVFSDVLGNSFIIFISPFFFKNNDNGTFFILCYQVPLIFMYVILYYILVSCMMWLKHNEFTLVWNVLYISYIIKVDLTQDYRTETGLLSGMWQWIWQEQDSDRVITCTLLKMFFQFSVNCMFMSK